MTTLAQLHSDWREAEDQWTDVPRDSLAWHLAHALADRRLDLLTEAARAAGWDRSQGAVLSWVAQRINEQPEQGEAA